MMRRDLVIGGVTTGLWQGGTGDKAPIILLPPGLCGFGTLGGLVRLSVRLWGPLFVALCATRRVIALDTLGQGGTAPGAAPTFDAAVEHLRTVLDEVAPGPVHLVGHDEGGLLALRLAFAVPDRVTSCTVVSSPAAAPTGDGLNPTILASPLEPRLSAQGQRWALERVSHSHHHVTDDLVEELAGSANDPALDPPSRKALERSLSKAKGATFADLRDTGLPVPACVIWGRDDPVCAPAHGRELLELMASRQPVAQMHLLNRAGYFPYREQPSLFAALLLGFIRSVET